MSRKNITTVIVVILIIAVVVLGVIGLFKKTPDSTTQTTNTATTSTSVDIGLTIDNYSGNTTMENVAIEKIVKTDIFNRTSSKSSLSGTVRAKSVVVTTSGTAKNTRFIVDIPSIKQSYVVSIGEDPSTGESSMYVLCPNAQEMIYPDFNCKDTTGI